MANQHHPSANERPKIDTAPQQQQFPNNNVTQQSVTAKRDEMSFQESVLAQNGMQDPRLHHGPNNETNNQPISSQVRDMCSFPVSSYSREPLGWPGHNLGTPLRQMLSQPTVQSPAQMAGSPALFRAPLGGGGYLHQPTASFPIQFPPIHGFCSTNLVQTPLFPPAMTPGFVTAPQSRSHPPWNTPQLAPSWSGSFSGSLSGSLYGGSGGGFAVGSPSPISSIRSSRVNSLESISTQSASGFSTDGGSSGLLQSLSANPFQARPIPMERISLGPVVNSKVTNERDDSEGRVSNLELRPPKSPAAAKAKSPTNIRRREKSKRTSSSSSSASKEKKTASSRKRRLPTEPGEDEDNNEPSPTPVNVVGQQPEEHEEEEDCAHQILDSLVPGSSRLNINFIDYGERGENVQYAKKKKGRIVIPDGLRGTHCCYKQKWEFEVLHSSGGDVIDRNLVPIKYKITDKDTLQVTEATETADDARHRRDNGRLIANEVFRKAMKARIAVLRARLEQETDEEKRKVLTKAIRILSPKRLTQGPLAFGLHHQIVQERMGVTIVEDPATKQQNNNKKEKKAKKTSSSSSCSESKRPRRKKQK